MTNNKRTLSGLLSLTGLLITGLAILSAFKPAPATSKAGSATGIEAVDQEINTFMKKYKVPGLSVAITKDDKLVYVKSYGMADREADIPASDQSLYRLASLSKQITSAVVMKLIEQGKLDMDDKVFGPGALLGTEFGSFPYKKGVTDITIDQLLHHTCGGWSNDDNKYPDPMFTNQGLNAKELISWTLDNIPLINTPGSHYDYSNFGYCILGRVIEKVTGLSYQAAAKRLVLQPCGISDMAIGGNGLQHRKPGEVRYYGQGGEDPYHMNVARMDSHGGWLATATDLARFMTHIDGSANDILQPATIKLMNTGSAANPNYGCGWSINGRNTWHTGSLPGTQTEQAITKGKGNFNFVILTNTRSSDSGFQHDMDRIFWNALAKNPEWPDVDLF